MKLNTIVVAILLSPFLFSNISVAAQFNFAPRATAATEYTDNVDLAKEDKKDDFIIVVGAGFTASLLGKTSGAELSYDQRYAFYNENSDNNGWRIPLDFRAWTSPSKSTDLELTNTFLLSENPVEQVQFGIVDGNVTETGDTTVRRSRDQYLINSTELRVTHNFSRNDKIYAAFRYGILRNEDEQIENNNNYTPSVGLDYWFGDRFDCQLYGAYTRGEFDWDSDFTGIPSSDFDNWLGTLKLNGHLTRRFSLFFQYDQIYRIFTSGEDNNYVVYAPSAGFAYNITQNIYSRLGMGYYYHEIENESDQNNVFLNAEISTAWNYRRGSIGLTGLTGLSQNDFGAQNLGFQRFASMQITADYKFTRKLSGNARAYYRFGLTPIPEDYEDDDDLTTNYLQAGLGFSYRPARWLSMRLGYTLNKYISSNDDDYTENRALLTVTLQSTKSKTKKSQEATIR